MKLIFLVTFFYPWYVRGQIVGEGCPVSTLRDPPTLTFEEIPKDKLGESTELRCSVYSIPQAKIYWTHAGKLVGNYENEYDLQLLNHGVTTLQKAVTQSTLYLDCADLDSGGTFTCVANNGCQTISAEMTVTLDDRASGSISCSSNKQAPQIYLWTDTVMERTGAQTQFMCRATGNPKPVISWYKIDSDDKQQKISNETGWMKLLENGDLLVTDDYTDPEGGKVFECVASNSAGNATVRSVLINIDL